MQLFFTTLHFCIFVSTKKNLILTELVIVYTGELTGHRPYSFCFFCWMAYMYIQLIPDIDREKICVAQELLCCCASGSTKDYFRTEWKDSSGPTVNLGTLSLSRSLSRTLSLTPSLTHALLFLSRQMFSGFSVMQSSAFQQVDTWRRVIISFKSKKPLLPPKKKK